MVVQYLPVFLTVLQYCGKPQCLPLYAFVHIHLYMYMMGGNEMKCEDFNIQKLFLDGNFNRGLQV